MRSIAPFTAASATVPGSAALALAAEIIVMVSVTGAWRIACR